jgi:SAM-dependent methyltransferase
MTLLTRWRRARRNSGDIDVRELLRTVADDELLASADAYFSGLPADSEQCRKPFSTTGESPDTARKLALLLQAADLFPGADVLDFGCGTGWLAAGIAQMGCRATGVDISPAAIRLAEARAAAVALPGPGSLRYQSYAGQRLPFEDAGFDRVVCFDAFHHVRDQAATIAELARVLRPGGRAAFVEPSPLHSLSAPSQQEMRRFRVIENDVRLEEIARHALTAGLREPQLLVQFQQPVRLSLADYQGGWSWSGLSLIGRAKLWHGLTRSLNTTQCFYLAKGEPARDSRSRDALAAELQLRRVERRPDSGLRCEVAVRNTGAGRWLTAGEGRIGTVNLGLQLARAGEPGFDVDFHRVALPTGGVTAGAEVLLQFDVQLPADATALRIDLVSEHVAWFGEAGKSRPLELDPRSAGGPASPSR